jgi:hypothetical protein
MNGFAKLLAILLLALAPAALTLPVKAQERPRDPKEARRFEGRAARRPHAYPAPVYAPPTPYARPYRVYPPAYAYPPSPAIAPAPNSLGAGWAQQQDQARAGVRQGRMIPLGRVMTGIRQTTPGRLLDAGLEPGPNGRPAYRVRWAAAGGRRIDFIVDAVTGAILARTGY